MKGNHSTRKTVLYIAQGGLIAAIYVALTLLFAPFSYGEVQVRISEALTILPYFTLAAVPGVSIGCLLANILGGAVIWDIIFGSIATLIGAVFTWRLRKRSPWLAPLPPIISNTIIIPLVLRYAYSVDLPIPLMMLSIAIGEVISCGVLGMLLLKVLTPFRATIFGDTESV